MPIGLSLLVFLIFKPNCIAYIKPTCRHISTTYAQIAKDDVRNPEFISPIAEYSPRIPSGMDLYSALMLNQKLKSSCDLCSVSKLRCDKGKPACSRCIGLNQLCSYSPARRVGRPNRLMRRSEQSQPQKPHPPQQQQQQQIYQTIPTKNSGYPSASTGDFIWNGDVSGNDTISSGTQMPEIAYEYGILESEPPENWIPNTHTSTGGDCVRAAASIVEQLGPAQSNTHLSAPNLRITTACQRLLTIMICPCSDQPAVALLVASGCIALMDMVCRHDDETSSPTNTAAVASPVSPWANTVNEIDENLYLDPNLFHWPTMSPPQSAAALNSLSGLEQGLTEGLAKIAKVVLRYTERYTHEPHKSGGGGSGAYTTLLVEPIVSLLRSNLQSVTQEVTSRLVL